MAMIVKNDMIVFCDVDDTLLMWNDVNWQGPGDNQIEITDPTDNSIVHLKPHVQHIALLKKYQAQGYTVIVWSAAGYRWADAAVKALKLEDVVTLVMSKPLKYVDDLTAKDILGNRVYIPFNQVNKIIEPALPENE